MESKFICHVYDISLGSRYEDDRMIEVSNRGALVSKHKSTTLEVIIAGSTSFLDTMYCYDSYNEATNMFLLIFVYAYYAPDK